MYVYVILFLVCELLTTWMVRKATIRYCRNIAHKAVDEYSFVVMECIEEITENDTKERISSRIIRAKEAEHIEIDKAINMEDTLFGASLPTERYR